MDKFFSDLTLLQAAPDAASTTGSMLTTLVPFALVFVIFYFLIIRPQNKKQKDMQKMIAGVKKGDKVITIGGVHAIVDKVKETTIVLKVDDNTRIEYSKSAIATVDTKGEASADAASEKPTDKLADKSSDKSSEAKK
ncbi:MAG: preprotein translocase subunit YajC [Rectinemataceae bacterium]